MKRGSAALGLAGLGLGVGGVVIAIVSSAPVGIAFVLIGLVALVLAVSDWAEFSADVRGWFGVKVTRHSSSQASPATPTAPELKILAIRATGGHSGAIDFAVELVNVGARFGRTDVKASVDGAEVTVNPPTVDLTPGALPETVRVQVPRPGLGDLVPAFGHETTLYGRTLTVVASTDGSSASERWTELVYSADENLVRFAIQRRIWAVGRGEDPSTVSVPAPHPLIEGAERVDMCKSCENPTAQVLEHLRTSGDGRVLLQLWKCRECGNNPAEEPRS